MFKSLIKFITGILVFVLIVDPGDLIFRLKIPLFVGIFGLWILLKLAFPVKVNKDILAISFIFLMIPVVGIISAIIQSTLVDPVFAIGFVKSFSVIVLLIVVFDLDLDLDVYLIRCSVIVPLIIIPIYIAMSVNRGLIVPIFDYLSAKDVAKFSNREFYGYKVVMLYYRTSPLLVFPLAYYSRVFLCGNRRIVSGILTCLFLFTLILSGTRANMLAGVVVVAYLLFYYLNRKKNKIPLIISCFVLFFVSIAFLKTLSFSKADDSANVKSGHVDSYNILFEENPGYLIWGQGLGSRFYSLGNKDSVSQTELTYFDLVRWFGIPIALILAMLILYPVIYLHLNKMVNNNNIDLIIAYFAYLFIAGTNPLLISSTGLLAIITMYSLIKKQDFNKLAV